jgi:hypothetical protein
MEKRDVIVEILQAVGVYEWTKDQAGPGVDIVRMFDENFEELCELVMKEAPHDVAGSQVA